MAPRAAAATVAPQKQARRAVPRIVPAIPHRFSRPPAAARPITPDESATAALTQREPTPQPAAEKASEERAATPLQTPLTPDSRASVANSGHAEEPVLASSPARSGDDHVEEAPQSQDKSGLEVHHQYDATREPLVETQPEPEIALVNGERSKPAIPAELPPEFHPKEKPSTQAPIVESMEPSSFPPPASVLLHPLQASVEGLVFGGAVQDSPAVPSTPQEIESDVRAQQESFPRPPPGFAPHLAPQFYPGHSHHPSDPAASWLQSAYSLAPPPKTTYGNGHDYHQPTYHSASAAYQAPYQAQFPLQDAQLAMNGATRSHSQSPNKSQFGEANAPSAYGNESLDTPYMNGNAPRGYGDSQERYHIAQHMYSLFGNPEFTDYILHIRSQDAMLLTLPIHAAIVSRSPVIMEALHHSAPPAFQTKDPRRLIDVLTDDRFIAPESLHEAIKILYAAPLLSAQSFLFNLASYDGSSEPGYTSNEARRRMGQVISYAAAGRVLQIPEMHACGLRIAKALIRWDTLDQVFHFGLSAGQTTVQPSVAGVDNRLLETYAIPLLDDALEFLAYNFPADFSLHSIASEMRENPRLPTVIESRQPTHNPRLSKIRFGDAPPEDDLKPSLITQTLSTILLSLPLPLLDRLFSHPAAANQVGWSGLVKIMRDVVEERERRRQKILKTQTQPMSDGMVPRALLENLYREESVEASPNRPSGHKLTASRVADPI